MDEKVHNYFNGNIKPFINLVHTVAQDWNEGVVNEEIVKKYLLTKYRNYLPTSIGYFFGELRTQAYIIHTQPSPTGIPEETQYFFINQSVNQVTQLFSLNTTSGTTQFSHYDFLYNITNEAFYNYGKLKCKEDNNIEGVFGAPYIVRNDGVEEFQLLFAGYQSLSFRALNAAIKIAKTIEECQQHFAIDIPFHIGISSGKSHVGNLGTNEFRCYAVVGEVKDIIVFDESSLIENFFIARPVDKIKIEEEIKIVYELIKESTIDADEWMYELERRKEIQKYLEFESVFNVLKEEIKEEEKEQFILDLNDALEKIANHVTLMPSDKVICNRIMSVITEILDCDTIEEMNSILNEYYSVVSIDVKLSKQRENIKF
ncbi:hypothetical protein ABK040_000771 [Willaertia magna]